MAFFQEKIFLEQKIERMSYIWMIKIKGKYCVSLFTNRNWAAYFDSFGTEYIPQEVLSKIKDKSITHNIFRIKHNEFIMCAFSCIIFIEYMLAVKTLLDDTNLFSLNDQIWKTNMSSLGFRL